MAKWLKKKERLAYVTAFIGIFITLAMVMNPEAAFEASLNGLRVWWEIVFPALLPFFIACEILMGLGVVHFMGALLEPLMRPVFRVPGVGAFALAMGLASGYPIGAKITSRLRKDNLCTRIEAERLISFTNTADPLFMVGAVAVGMFKRPELGLILAGSHYISSLLLGFLLRFHGLSEEEPYKDESLREGVISKAFRELYRARSLDGRSFGQLFGDSVRDSVNTLLLIGGFIITFSVLIRLLDVFGIISTITDFLIYILRPLNINNTVVRSLVNGFFEITIGTETASQATGTLSDMVMAASAIMAWSGLSVHAQVASMITGTDIRLHPYLIARCLHAILAAGVTYFAMDSITVLAPIPVSFPAMKINILQRTLYTGERLLIFLGILFLISLLFYIAKNVKIMYIKMRD